jgi:hypothetical protein
MLAKMRFNNYICRMDNELKGLRSAILENENKIMRSMPLTMPEEKEKIINSIQMAVSPEHDTEAKDEYFIRKMNRNPSPTKSTTPVYLVKITDCSKDDVLNANKKGHVQEAYEMDSCRMFTSLYNEVSTLINIPNDSQLDKV